MIIKLGVSHQRDVTTIVAITPTEDGGMLVLYTGTHLEGDSTGTIQIDLKMIQHSSARLLRNMYKALEDAEQQLQNERDANAMLTAEIERLRK